MCGKGTVLAKARTFGQVDVSSNLCFEYQDHQNIRYTKIIFLGYKFFCYIAIVIHQAFLRDTFSTAQYILHSNISHCHLHHLHLHICQYLFLELYQWIL